VGVINIWILGTRAASPCQPSGEEIGAGRRELHKSSGILQFQPAPFNDELQAGAVLRGRTLVAEQEGAVELLDVGPAVLNGLEGVGVLHQPTRRLLRFGERTLSGVLHCCPHC